MRPTAIVSFVVAASAIATLVAASRSQPAASQNRAVFPDVEWARVEPSNVSAACRAGLEKATATAKGMATTGAIAIRGGRVLWDYGDLTLITYLASVRKSILAMMYGKYVENGAIKLDATMADLGIDDLGGLMPEEKKATVADLLAARSGVYHEAANAACTGCGSTAGAPPGPRGSVPHGSYFLYNNWDFNALGTIFEQRTGKNIYDAFAEDFAAPLQMQDFDRAAQRKSQNAQASVHPAYHFYLSTRDMARVGYLMLREGQWAGKSLISRQWVRRMVTAVTPVAEMHPDDLKKGPFGYGYLWWLWDGPFNTGPYRGAYTGIGAIGQFITVVPGADLVVAHKTRQGAESVSRPQYLALLDTLVTAPCGG